MSETRQEAYLTYLAGDTDVTLPEPVTQLEKYWHDIAERVSGAVDAPTGTIELVENGEYSVAEYATAKVNVPEGNYERLTNAQIDTRGQIAYVDFSGSSSLSSFFVVTGESSKQGIVEVGDVLKIGLNKDLFGDAADEQVVSGVTYTSKNGLKRTGSHVCSGGSAPKLQDKTITENGTYSADEGYDGLETVTVSVSGGENPPADGYFTVNFYSTESELINKNITKIGHYAAEPPNHEYSGWKDENGEIYPELPVTKDESVVINLYAYIMGTDYSQLLYDAFGIDKTAYPYVAVAFSMTNDSSGSYMGIGFGSSWSYLKDNGKNGGLKLTGPGQATRYVTGYTSTTVADVELGVNFTIENKDRFTLTNNGFEKYTSSCVLYTNFAIEMGYENTNSFPNFFRLDA